MEIDKINQAEAVRYLGYKKSKPDEKIQNILDECEQCLKKVIKPKYIYKIFDINFQNGQVILPQTSLVFKGKDIYQHLLGCEKCVLLAATLSSQVDMFIRSLQAYDMMKAFAADCLASAAIEQVCDHADKEIGKIISPLNQTWRFSPGYGDFPLDIQNDFINVLDASKRIGLNVTANSILTPRKSVTAVIGISSKEISKGKRGCVCCIMKDNCQFKKRGEHCGI